VSTDEKISAKKSNFAPYYQLFTSLPIKLVNFMPRKQQGWVTFQTSEEERKILEEFCQQSQRSKTEILREMVRTLGKSYTSPLPTSEESSFEDKTPPLPTPKTRKKAVTQEQNADEIEISTQKKALKVSSRNLLKGVVTEIVRGAVNSEVTLEIVHRVKLTSVITRVSAEELELAVGEEAYAVIKSTDIVIAKE
jgi:molybdopterin-binding protein